MVGTENGVGVKNAGVMEAYGDIGAISLNVNGKITFAQSTETETDPDGGADISTVTSRVAAQKILICKVRRP